MNTPEPDNVAEKYAGFRRLTASLFSPHSCALIDRALELADRSLAGMVRYDGSPLIDHSTGTAAIVAGEIGLGRNSTISALLHDAVRLGSLTPEQAGAAFGDECTGILKALCNISGVDVKVEDEQTDNFRDLIISYAADPRVILIKLADRLEVMRSLGMFPPEKRIRKSWETLKLYAQIAHKLGLYSIKSEMEDASLRWLEPAAYEQIRTRLEATAAERDDFIRAFIAPVEARMRQAGIKYTVKSRTKTIYSIWTKMRRMRLPFEEIYDIFALRVIVDCPREDEKRVCWSVYSIVTDFYTPNPERLRDWISIPKSNGYESLHTTVVDREGHWVEIQIRSERMDEVAERGIAAHWRYKGVNQGGAGSEQWLARLREMMEHEDPQVAGNEAKPVPEAPRGEIFVFTPKGDLRKLPEGATLLDFAFDIHSGLGATTTGGRVNQRNVPIKEVLHNGDIVEIFTSKSQKPKADWLNMVTTGKARGKIRAHLREEQAREAGLGREELERKIKNWKITVPYDDAVTALCRHFKCRNGTELYGRIAAERIDMGGVKELLVRMQSGEPLAEAPKRAAGAPRPGGAASDDSLVIDEEIRDLDYKLARCCNPIRGDGVFGFVTVNSGITIHRETCPNAARLREMYPYRVIPARWRESRSEGAFQASIRITTDNVPGIVNRITDVVTHELKVNIRSMSIAPNDKNELTGIINIEVKGSQIVDAVTHSIMRIKGVQRAYRVNN